MVTEIHHSQRKTFDNEEPLPGQPNLSQWTLKIEKRCQNIGFEMDLFFMNVSY